MKVLELSIENVKRIKHVTIAFADGVTEIGGRNAQGKSTAIDCLDYALGGKRTHPPRVIRDGETYAEVVVKTDTLIIERQWSSEKDSKLFVKRIDGTPLEDSPQAILDALRDEKTFDPGEALRMKPAELAEILRGLVGIDFSALDEERERIYVLRTAINKEIKNLEGALSKMPPVEAPDELVEMVKLVEEHTAALEKAEENDAVRRGAKVADEQLAMAKAKIAEAESAIEGLDQALVAAKNKLSDLQEAEDHAVTMVNEAGDAVMSIVEPDFDEIRGRMNLCEQTNAKVRAKQARAKVRADEIERTKAADAITDRLDAIDAEKVRLLSEAKFPVPGLSFGLDGLATFNGLPLIQASQAEQIRVMLAIAFARNPELKLVSIRNGSLLDDEARATVCEMTAAVDGQVIIERVLNDGETCAVVIEDGERVERVPVRKSRKKSVETAAGAA